MKKLSKIINILFYISIAIYIVEFLFVRGLFTTFIAGGMLLLFGIINIIKDCIVKSYLDAFIVSIVVLAVMLKFVLIFAGVII